jgi:exodeoxyribonuclease VII small subunit
MSAAKEQTIAEKLEQLEALLSWFESEEITVEEALTKYEEALKLSKELESQLEKAKNQVEVIKKKFAA